MLKRLSSKIPPADSPVVFIYFPAQYEFYSLIGVTKSWSLMLQVILTQDCTDQKAISEMSITWSVNADLTDLMA